MNIQAYPDSGLWILAANVRAPDVKDIGTSHARETSQNTFEKCWTGEGWADVAGAAQRFLTRQEADNYLAEHRDQMEQATMSTTA
jgi:hypothetical protein